MAFGHVHKLEIAHPDIGLTSLSPVDEFC
jgi:hypothetical protein